MKIMTDKEKCIDHDIDRGTYSELFRIGNDRKAYVKNPHLIIYCVQKAVDECPADAITIEKEA